MAWTLLSFSSWFLLHRVCRSNLHEFLVKADHEQNQPCRPSCTVWSPSRGAHLPVAFVVTFDDGITEEFSLDLASGSSVSAVPRGAFSWTSCDGVGRAADEAEGATETKAPKSALLEAARPPAPQDSSSRAAIICNWSRRKRQLFFAGRGIWTIMPLSA